ncbi:MAG TPA: hypothetical protein VI814_14980 [Candidatus Limnocylindria bacterium]
MHGEIADLRAGRGIFAATIFLNLTTCAIHRHQRGTRVTVLVAHAHDVGSER